ncbi:MAG: hypothetical protein QM640_13085 [Niabella sp.]
MAKPDINNYEDLMEEKERLKAGLKNNKAHIRQSFGALKEELNPFSQLRKTAQTALKANTANPVIQFGIRRAADFLVGKVFLKRAGWLPRLIVPLIVKQVATRVVGHKADKKIAGTLRKAAHTIRDIHIPEFGKNENKGRKRPNNVG